jgi:serine/threonine protein kinase
MFRVGQQFGIYTLMQHLGRGAFGDVWLAERSTKFLTTQVAVKLPLDEQVDHAAIQQEAQLWARASGHANVLPIIEANEYDGQILIVSEYAGDGSLEGLLQKNSGALPVKQAVEMMVGILKGLEFLHSRQIIHRDIKPANILLQGDTPRLADFGISRVIKTTSQATKVEGTLPYMAPEAFQRKRNAQTDVWSVGVMLYEMLKGELPFSGDNPTDLFGAIMLSEPAPLPDSIPLKLQKIVGKALSKDIAGRYQTAHEMREELDECWLRLSPPAAAQTQEPSTVKKADNKTTIIIPVSSPKIIGQRSEIKKPNGRPDNHSVSPPASPQVKAKTNRLYLAFPAIVLVLLAIIAASYWLRDRTSVNTVASNNTYTPPVTTSSPRITTETPLIPFHKGNKWGFSDGNKKLVIEAKYYDVYRFSEGLAEVRLDFSRSRVSNFKSGFVDKTGNEVIPLKYDYADSFSEGMARVELKRKDGFIDKTGKEVIPLKYDSAQSFSEGLAEVNLNNKRGFIDKTGKEVIPLKYEDTDPFSDGLARVRLNGKEGFIDKTGKEVIPLKYDDVHKFREGLARVRLNGKEGFVDKTGNEVIPVKYEQPDFFWRTGFSEGLAQVRLNGKEGFIDKMGEEVIPLKYDYADSFSEGLARVELNGKWAFIDKTGEEVIPIKYHSTQSFSEGLARVELNGKEGFIDKAGNEIIPLKYDDVHEFREGLAQVSLKGKKGFIDKTGKEVIPVKYDIADEFREGLARVFLGNTEFYIDKNGTEYYKS